jgi:uncharacterized OB-fold protein
LTGVGEPTLTPVARHAGSRPLVVRRDDGTRNTYVDPRLQREVGIRGTVKRLGLAGGCVVAAVAGVPGNQLGAGVDVTGAVEELQATAAAVLRVLTHAIENHTVGLAVAAEQSTISVAELHGGATTRIVRDEVTARELPVSTVTKGVGIPISMPAYSRAFEPKIRWEAAVFEERPGIDTNPVFPPRMRVDNSGVLAREYRLEPLPRTGTVYTHTTVRIPVPDLPSPYSLAVVQLDDSPVRVLLKVTGVPAGEATIGQPGSVVLRRIALRTGVPDYGYAFWPGRTEEGVNA